MKNRKKIVVFTGAGVSADSGISTFRDSDGLWDKYRIEDVCTPEALARNRKTVIDFYNIRRRELLSKEPNAGHYAIRKLEDHFDVEVVTQNIDDLHERPAARTSPTCTANCVNCAAAPTNRWSYRSKVGNNTSTTAPRTDRCCVRSWSFSARASRCSTARPESPLRRIS